MLCQSDLFFPAFHCDHAEMSDGDAQIRIFCDQLLHGFCLQISVSHVDSKELSHAFCLSKDFLMNKKILISQPSTADLYAVEPGQPFILNGFLFIQAADLHPLRVFLFTFQKVTVLITVYIFLRDHTAADPRIIHVCHKHFHSIAAVKHIRRHHLSQFAAEIAPAAGKRDHRFPVHTARLRVP